MRRLVVKARLSTYPAVLLARRLDHVATSFRIPCDLLRVFTIMYFIDTNVSLGFPAYIIEDHSSC